MKSGLFVFLGLWGLWASAIGQTEILAIEFNQDDQAGFNGWLSALSGASSIADFETDAELTSGTTKVQVSASTGLTFTLTTEPGFLYQIEVSSDLQSWKSLGNSIFSKSETTTFTDTIQVDRRFYRFFRIP